MRRPRPPDRVSGPGAIAADRAAFEAFYLAHFGEVLGFVTRRVADAHTAADLTAEVFTTALDAAPSYRGEGTAGAWLTGIARHVVAAEYRRAAQDRAAVRRANGRRLLDDDDISRLEERIDAERDARALWEQMQQLTESQRSVIELVVIDGLSLAESAAALGIPPVTARVRLHRARRALRRLPPAQQHGKQTHTAAAPLEVGP
jgi:RNA polymerase sigma-70 factor (ECF subfamily)